MNIKIHQIKTAGGKENGILNRILLIVVREGMVIIAVKEQICQEAAREGQFSNFH